MNSPKLIILDFDGTLADTRELIVRTNQEAMRRLGYPVSDEPSIVATIGLPLVEGILVLFPDLPHRELPTWVTMYRDVFDEHEPVAVLRHNLGHDGDLLHVVGLVGEVVLEEVLLVV